MPKNNYQALTLVFTGIILNIVSNLVTEVFILKFIFLIVSALMTFVGLIYLSKSNKSFKIATVLFTLSILLTIFVSNSIFDVILDENLLMEDSLIDISYFTEIFYKIVVFFIISTVIETLYIRYSFLGLIDLIDDNEFLSEKIRKRCRNFTIVCISLMICVLLIVFSIFTLQVEVLVIVLMLSFILLMVWVYYNIMFYVSIYNVKSELKNSVKEVED